MNSTYSTQDSLNLLLVERERRQRNKAKQAREQLRCMPLSEFISHTKIEVPVNTNEQTLVPFIPWTVQCEVLETIIHNRLIVLLKTRQIGMSWLVCAFVMRMCTLYSGQIWFFFSKGLLEANELTRRTALMYQEHQDKAKLPILQSDNKQELVWSNSSRVMSLPATKGAGRSMTASGVVLDEWAFMQWPRETLAAVKPIIDAGGKLIIISSGDGNNTEYHQFWNAAKAGESGYKTVFIPWYRHPDRGEGWRDQKILEAPGDHESVLREYPENDVEAFIHAVGLIYDVWSDGPADGNVTEAAEYVPDAGPVYWAVDDGYTGEIDASTGYYTGTSHPRVFLLCQMRSNGQLCVFAEHFAIKILAEQQISAVVALGYPQPDFAAVDKSAAELKGRLHAQGLYTYNGPSDVEESIKELRDWLAKDTNGFRRILVHPRCKNMRAEMASYRRDTNGKPVKQFDHSMDSMRYLCWVLRHER